MNSFKGNISHINSKGNVSIVTIVVSDEISLKSIVLETPKTASFLRLNNDIMVLFKETEVIISIGDKNTSSIENCIPGSIEQIEKGALLSKIIVSTTNGLLTAIISTEALVSLNLKIEQKISALIKLNELMLSDK